jgi:hypothetical protein
VDNDFLSDMGRMSGRLPSAARCGSSPVPSAAARGRAFMYTLIGTAKLNGVDP